MERKLHLPEWVKSRVKRQQEDEHRSKANALAHLRAQAMEAARQQSAHMPSTRKATKAYITKMERRRRGKRASLARRGKPTHNFRIHT